MSETRTWGQWVKRLRDEDEPLTLAELHVRMTMLVVDNLAVVDKHVQQLMGPLTRLEQHLIVLSGGNYPVPNDERMPYVVARSLLQAADDPAAMEQISRDLLERLATTREALIERGSDEVAALHGGGHGA